LGKRAGTKKGVVQLSPNASPDTCVVVIFGATGDLAKRKLFPALHNLQVQDFLPRRTVILGTGRTEYDDESYRKEMRAAVEEHSRIAPSDESWDEFSEDVHYLAGDVTDDLFFDTLKKKLEELDEECDTCGNRVWYLATYPDLFEPVIEGIGKAGMVEAPGWHRLVVEKPFGKDKESAHELNSVIQRHFAEDQVFRIDHYLGKETVQNLLVFRFANAIFEPIWNRRYIDHVQITVAENRGIETRGAFYDKVGALRDVGQNHLLQCVSLIAMEPPVSWDPDSIRSEKVQVLRAVRRLTTQECSDNVARGQYEGYLDEEGIAKSSSTETFFAMRLFIESWRWAGVPFYIRTGKKLPAQATEIAIQFNEVPHLLFEKTSVEELDPNVLIMRIQPREGISLRFGMKVPGPEVNVRTVDMEFEYEQDFGSGSAEAYERLLLDLMLGDTTLFTRADEIEQAWDIVDPVLKYWSQGGRPGTYAPETWGPRAADELIGRDIRRWRTPGAG
jgi:glucose-6-phosphate 1-dehydrogenase